MPLFSPIRLIKSFKYALKGMQCAFLEEQNFRFHIISAILVIILMFLLDTSILEKIILIILISFVLTAELLNSIFERIIDILKPRLHPYAKKIKDMTAAVVFIAAFVSFVCGLIIFISKIFEILR
jgi:diacylglycerol kinase